MLRLQFIRDHYAIRFPELEQVIADPWEYINTVKAIGNAEVSCLGLAYPPDLHLTNLLIIGFDETQNPTNRTSRSRCQHDGFHL